jgi:hypothetical protein
MGKGGWEEERVVSNRRVTPTPPACRPQIHLDREANSPLCKEKMAPKTGRFGLSVRVGGPWKDSLLGGHVTGVPRS